MQVGKLSDLGGADVTGVDLSRPQSPDEARALKALYDEHGLVCFRDQKLTKRQLVDAGASFGGTMMKPEAAAPDPDVPAIMVISTRGTNGEIVPEDPDKLVGDLEWHTDQAYVTAPNRGKILYSVNVPEKGGMTGFIDGQLTYEALPDAMKQRIANLHVIQSWNRAERYLAGNRDYRVDGSNQLAADRYPNMAYRVVHNHPITGKKVLNVPPLWSAGIVEMPGPEGDDLMEELKLHIKQPKFQYWHKYRVGDAVIWDNWRFLHAASGTPGRYVRTLWSIAINQGPVFGYALPKAMA